MQGKGQKSTTPAEKHAKGKPPSPPHLPSRHQKQQPPNDPKSLSALSLANKQEIERLTHHAKQMSVLSQVRSALSSLRVVTLENNFRRILCLVISLGHKHPLIKWSIKLALHEASQETGRSPWDIERELYRVMYRRDAEPIEKLVRFAEADRADRSK
jgi:hypothetical protein